MSDPCSGVVDTTGLARPVRPNVIELPRGTDLWHVGAPGVPFDALDERQTVRYRFSPLHGRGGGALPVMYAAATEAAAIAETLWHDLPLTGARLIAERYQVRPIGTVRTTRTLKLAELHDPGLRALGLDPNQVSNTDAICYHRTIAFAQAIVDDNPNLDGLVWMSRRYNTDKTYLLWRRPGRKSPVTISHVTTFADPDTEQRLLDLCRTANITIVPSTIA